MQTNEVPKKSFIRIIFSSLILFIKSIFKGIINFFSIIKKGDMKTKLSFIIMGLGCFLRGQRIKGIIYAAIEVIYIIFIVDFGWGYLKDITTLGTKTQYQVWNEALQIYENKQGDNSMLILLFSVLTVLVTIGFLAIYVKNVLSAYKAELMIKEGKNLPKFKDDIRSLINENFHKTLLTLPVLGIICFVILPLIFMILIAFTNFDRFHQPPGNLFTWVGLQNFKDVFGDNPLKAYTFRKLLTWTLIWAFFATFTNYILGMILALMINKKGIKFKGVWRTIFVLTIAVPQFVSLLLMSKLFHNLGPINVILQNAGIINTPINFLTNGTLAKIVVVVVNMWVGIPYTMLITSGILMNIPEDIYESARIDGAGPVACFFRITLPYMFFVTTPYLITQFIGNINNFNVIYLLTGGGPLTLNYFQAGETDLLVTWLYKLTVNEQNYSLASTIGILVFVLSAVFSLLAYNMSSSVKKEDSFQ